MVSFIACSRTTQILKLEQKINYKSKLIASIIIDSFSDI